MGIADILRAERGIESPEARYNKRITNCVNSVVEFFVKNVNETSLTITNNCMGRKLANDVVNKLIEEGFVASSFILRPDRPSDSYWGIEVKL